MDLNQLFVLVCFFAVWQIGIPSFRNISGSRPPVCYLPFCILESCFGRSLEVRDIGINNLNRKNLNSRQLGFLLGFFSFLFIGSSLFFAVESLFRPVILRFRSESLHLRQWIFLLSGVVNLRYVCLCFLLFTLQKLTLSS